MMRIELLVCQDLYIELAFTPKMTLLRSETGTLKFVPTSEGMLSSQHISGTSSVLEESENPYQVESGDKVKYSPNPHFIGNCSNKTTSIYLEKLSEMIRKPFNNEPVSIKSLVSTDLHRCSICKRSFKSKSGAYKHAIKCRRDLENLLDNIKPLESILLKPSTKDGTDQSEGISSHLKNFLHCDKQDNEDNWTLATRTASGTLDDPAYFFVKKFVLPKYLLNSLDPDRKNYSKQESKNPYGFSKKVSLPPSSIDVTFTEINKPPVLSCTVNEKTIENPVCKFCKLSFSSSRGLYQHGLKCTKPLPIKSFKPTNHICKICEISFKTSLGLYKHGLKCKKPLEIKVSNKKRICARCNKSFTSYSGMYQHRFKCGKPIKAGKNVKVLKTDLPELYSPIEIGEIIHPSDSLSDEDTLSCDSPDDEAAMAAAGTIDEPATYVKRNLLQPQKGQSSSLDTSRRANSEKVKFMIPYQLVE